MIYGLVINKKDPISFKLKLEKIIIHILIYIPFPLFFLTASKLCKNCGKKQNLYDPKKSKTYKKEGKSWKISYGDGSNASGITAFDTINLGGLKIKNQRIELAVKESSSFATGPNDGLLGLGFNK